MQVHMASFSIEGGISSELSFEQGEDANGKYIEFVIPVLEYWDMVYMK